MNETKKRWKFKSEMKKMTEKEKRNEKILYNNNKKKQSKLIALISG